MRAFETAHHFAVSLFAMRTLLVLTMLACRGEPAPPSSTPPMTTGSGSGENVLRLDRPASRIGGPQTWTHATPVVALAFCPGDRELVTLDDSGRLRRFTIASGEQTSSAALGALAPHATLACGDDDLTEIDDGTATIRVDRWGTIARVPAVAGPSPPPKPARRRPLRSARYELERRGTSLHVTRLADDFRREIRDSCVEASDALAISRDGEHVAIACRQPLGIRIFELASGVQTTDDLPSLAAARLAWSPRRDRLALRSPRGAIHVWGEQRLADKPISAGHAVWWHGDREVALDTALGILAWTPPDGPTRSLDATPGVRASTIGGRAMVVLAEPHAVATALVDNVARDIALPTGKPPRIVDRVAIAPGGRRAILVPREQGGLLRELVELDLVAGVARVTAIDHTAVALDDRRIVIAREGGDIFEVGAAAPLARVGRTVTAIALDGELLATGTTDGAIVLWRAGVRLGTLTGHDGAIVELAFSGDGQLASSGTDTTLVWDLRS